MSEERRWRNTCTPKYQQQEWLKLRKTGIGGSDAGAICGLNPYNSPMKVYQDKTCEESEEMDHESIRQGHDLEDYVAQRFMEATGRKVRRSNYMYRSMEHPFMIADVDRLIVGEDAGLECKTASAYNADKWKDGKIPLHYTTVTKELKMREFDNFAEQEWEQMLAHEERGEED